MVTDYWLIMLSSLILGLAAGALMQRSDFCMTAVFRDYFLFRSTSLPAALLALVAVSSLLYEIIRIAGGFPYFPFPLFTPPTLAGLCGGAVFGFGMVLAGGCVVGHLYRLGAGSPLSVWGIAGLVAGSALYAEIHPAWSSFARSTRLSSAITIPQATGLPPWLFVLLLTAVTAGLFFRFPGTFLPPEGWRSVRGYIPPAVAAVVLALLGALSAVLVGMPLGVTTSYAKFAGLVESRLAPGHLAATPFFQGKPLDIVLPLSPSSLKGGAGPDFDGIAVIQYPLILGIILGSGLSALSLGEWRWRRGAPPREKVSVLSGGIIMGLASRMTPGCNIWHLWGGLPIFAGQSLLFLAGLLPGAWLGGKVLARWVLPDVKEERQ